MTLTTIKKAGLDEIALDHVFTIGASGTDHYTFQGEGLNGTVNDPTLYLTRGKTYRFENGSGGHPLRIQSTSGQSGTAYNTGVTNNNTTGTVIMEVQHDAPDVLYYQCTSHANMNGILYITGALADGGVTTAKIADDAVTSAKLGAGSVDNTALANDSINGNKLQDNCVATSEIQDDAVTSAKIVSGAVTNGKLAADAVTSAKIANSAVTNSKLGDDCVTGSRIADDAVDNEHIANDAVTYAKIQNVAQDRILGRQSSGSGDVQELNAGNVRLMLNVADGATADDLTALSASNLTSGTIPDARFPATLPAISGANLTNLPGGGKVTRIFSVESSGTSNYYYYSQGNPWITTGAITNVSANSRFLIFARFELRLQNSHGSIKAYCNWSASGGTTYGGQSNNTGSNSYQTTQFTAYDAASNTNNRQYSFNSYSTGSISQYGADVRNGFIVVLELDVS